MEKGGGTGTVGTKDKSTIDKNPSNQRYPIFMNRKSEERLTRQFDATGWTRTIKSIPRAYLPQNPEK
jgi:hypothetical protein